jgi:hypothetical protein
LFQSFLYKPSNKNTGTTGNTDGKTRGDKHTIKKTETTVTTDDKTGGDKLTNKKIETTANNDGKVLPSVVPVV